MIKRFVFAFFLICIAVNSFSQETSIEESPIDDLFSEDVEDIVITETQKDYKELVEKEEKIKISGYFSAVAGAAGGFVSWPTDENWTSNLDMCVGASAKSYISFDIKPNNITKIKMAFLSTLSPFSAMKWGDFKISELWCDYNFKDNVFFRVGQFTSTWGLCRLFKETNLLYGSEDWITLKASVPTVLSGLNFYTWGSGTVTSYKDLSYATKLDAVMLDTLFSLAGIYKIDAYSYGMLSLKKVMLSTDFYIDTVLKFKTQKLSGFGTIGFFKEWNDLKLVAEYYMAISENSFVPQAKRAGIVIGYNNIFNTPIDVGINVMQSFDDFSGYVLAAITWSPFSYITLNIGLPIVYGNADSYYVNNNYMKDDEDAQASSIDDYCCGLVFKLTMKVNF